MERRVFQTKVSNQKRIKQESRVSAGIEQSLQLHVHDYNHGSVLLSLVSAINNAERLPLGIPKVSLSAILGCSFVTDKFYSSFVTSREFLHYRNTAQTTNRLLISERYPLTSQLIEENKIPEFGRLSSFNSTN
jgi:hypothetical protein